MASCKYGKLKHPVGRRKCKKAPRKAKKAASRRKVTRVYVPGTRSAPATAEAFLNGARRRRRRRR